MLLVTTKNNAYYVEQLLRPSKNIGWNVAIGGGLPPSCLGRKHSEETKRKISESNKTIKAKNPRPSPMKGRSLSEAQKKHISSVHKGKTLSKEHIASMKEKLSGANNYKATTITLVHMDSPEIIRTFDCIKDAAEKLGINYSSLRCQHQERRTTYNRKGWKILWKVQE